MHFPPQNKLHKIFNRNTLKLSYSCTKKKKKKNTWVELSNPITKKK